MSKAARDSLEDVWRVRDPLSSAAESVYAAIREAILSGILQPGFKLGEEELAGRLSVSRTPVREAILRLEAEKLAARAPRRGLVVASVDRDEIIEVYVVRVGLDALAARLAAENAGPADVASLQSINAQLRAAASAGDWDSMAWLNLDFHEALARAGRNNILSDLIRQIHDRVRRFPGTTFAVADRGDRAVREHDAVLEAVNARDASRAEEAARDHMTSAMYVRIQMLAAPADQRLGLSLDRGSTEGTVR